LSNLNFTNTWFDTTAKPVWEEMIPNLNPKKILEVGSFEGASTCYLINKLSHQSIEIHCIDTWEGGIEHQVGSNCEYNMNEVKERFDNNILLVTNNNVDLHIHRGFSDVEMCKLLANDYQDYFDFVYIDGSHQASDVLCDAVLGFRLLNIGGAMVFDDYIWHSFGKDLYQCPKPAIDSFVNLYWPKLEITTTPCQLIIQKIRN
jgi:predicted O-methyltransferase YrrM